MPKILCIGDLHLGHTRLALCSSVLQWIAKAIVEHKPDAVVYLGDVFDTHAVIRSECLTIWTKHLNDTLNYCSTYWLMGNHEMHKPNDSTYNSLIPYSGWRHKNLNVITKSCEINDLGFVPYLTNKQSWEEEANGINTQIVFTHNTFVGADFGNTVATSGITKESVGCSTVNNRIIISGHIHKQQQLDFNLTKIVYPGTPYSWSANDIDMTKGLMLIDSETLKMSFIESPFPSWRRVDVLLSNSNDISIPPKVKPEDHLLVRVTGYRSDVKRFLNSSSLSDLKKIYSSVSVSTIFLDSAKSESNVSKIQVSTAEDTINSYMDSVYNGSVDINLIKKAIFEAMEISNVSE